MRKNSGVVVGQHSLRLALYAKANSLQNGKTLTANVVDFYVWAKEPSADLVVSIRFIDCFLQILHFKNVAIL